MTDEEKYLFDVAGYLVVDDVLSRDHYQRLVDALHEIISTPRDQLLLRRELVAEELAMENGLLALPRRAGLEVELNLEALEKCEVDAEA
jgi:hypothetical protein